MTNVAALNYARLAMSTAGGVHGRNLHGSQDIRDLCDAILQLVRAVESLAQAVK